MSKKRKEKRMTKKSARLRVYFFNVSEFISESVIISQIQNIWRSTKRVNLLQFHRTVLVIHFDQFFTLRKRLLQSTRLFQKHPLQMNWIFIWNLQQSLFIRPRDVSSELHIFVSDGDGVCVRGHGLSGVCVNIYREPDRRELEISALIYTSVCYLSWITVARDLTSIKSR